MPCRATERAVSGTRDGRYGEMRVAPFLSARLGGLSDGGGVVDGCGREVCRGRGGVISMSLLFFLPHASNRRGEHRLLVSWKRLVYSVLMCVSMCVSLFVL